jgi:hypothetical protein
MSDTGSEVFIGVGVFVGGKGEGVGEIRVGNFGVDVVGIAVCVSTIAASILDMAVFITSVGLIVGGDTKRLQAVNITTTRNRRGIALLMTFISLVSLHFLNETPNGLRYPLVGGTRLRHFDGTNFKPRKLLENAQTPTSRVHAVLGSFMERKTC